MKKLSEKQQITLDRFMQRIDDIEKGKTLTIFPPLEKDCPECGGSGYISSSLGPVVCRNCQESGKVPNHLTPEQFVAWMRTEGGRPDFELQYTDRVWAVFSPWNEWRSASFIFAKKHAKSIIVVVPGQPKPKDDWRPKK